MDEVARHRQEFRALHEGGCFAIPNPWDAGGAYALSQLGFKALATTSSGYAFSRGLPDAPDVLRLEDVLTHVAEIVAAADLPVSADFQAGYAESAEGVAANVARCVDTGVAGLSIEDTHVVDDASSLFELAEALERVTAAREDV